MVLDSGYLGILPLPGWRWTTDISHGVQSCEFRWGVSLFSRLPVLKNAAIICSSLGLVSRNVCITTGSGCVLFPVMTKDHVLIYHVSIVHVVMSHVKPVKISGITLPLVSVPVIISWIPPVMIVPTVNKPNDGDQKLQSNWLSTLQVAFTACQVVPSSEE